jgi:hypothetical protein
MPGFTLGALSLVLAGVGTGVTAYNQYKQGKAAESAGTKQREASESQAALADFNAQVADLQAKDAIERGAEEESRFRTQVRGAIGTQRAGIAASNIDVGFGSAVDVQADAAYLGELDALTIRTNAAREAWGYKVQATDLRKRADIARKEGVYLEAAGKQASSGSKLAIAGTLLGGTASLLQTRYGFQRETGYGFQRARG